MSWCKCPGVPRGHPPGMAADKCITLPGVRTEFYQVATWEIVAICATTLAGSYTMSGSSEALEPRMAHGCRSLSLFL